MTVTEIVALQKTVARQPKRRLMLRTMDRVPATPGLDICFAGLPIGWRRSVDVLAPYGL